MTMQHFSRILVIAAWVSATPASVSAQITGVLNTFDVQRLVTADTPAAHAMLGKHFGALADKYAADAARSRALATVPAGNPHHAAPVGANPRRVRQADAAMSLSDAARSVAAYHQFLSIGSNPSAPPDRTAFDGGLGATVPTNAEVKQAVASARTGADHHVFAEYFLTVAARESTSANEHRMQARMFRVSGRRRGADCAAMQSDRLEKLARAAAKNASAKALLHRQLASIG
jgi:hypothetical protein